MPAEPSKCKLCGAKHWSYEPHQWPKGVTDNVTPTEIVTDNVTSVEARFAALEARVAAIEGSRASSAERQREYRARKHE